MYFIRFWKIILKIKIEFFSFFILSPSNIIKLFKFSFTIVILKNNELIIRELIIKK